MNNVHESAPVTFETRWTLSYLRGPLTRAQIKQLSGTRPAAAPPPPASKAKPARPAASETQSRVILPPDIPQVFVPLRGSHEGVVYQPHLLGAVQIRFSDAKSKVDTTTDQVFLTPIKNDAIPVQWEEASAVDIDANALEHEAPAGATFATLPAAAGQAKNYAKWSKDLVTWLYGSQQLTIYKSPSTKMCSNPGETEAAFRARIDQKAREDRDAAVEQLRQKYATKITVLQDRLLRAQHALAREQEQARQQTWSTALSVGTSVLGALMGRKTISKSTVTAVGSAARQAARGRKEAGDVGRAEETVSTVEQQLKDLEAQLKAETDTLQSKLDATTESLETVTVKPKKTNISVRLFTLAWVPYRGEEAAW
jgi:hypothetical protein